ncbi:Rho-GAP domain-containing protein [Plasmodiophora brassicae]
MDVRFTVRFLLANGEQSVQLCRGSATIVSLKRLLIRKKPHCFPENTVEQDIAMRLANARLFVLSDDDSLLSVLSRWPLFRESDDADVTPDIVVFPTADVNDQLKVQERKLSAGDPIVVAGPLQRRRKNSTKFKKQYCVIQSFTLFSFASESDYRHHRPAVQAYPLGSCQFADVPGIPFAFQIVVEMLCPGKSLVLKADDSAEYRMWMNALELITYRYAKCTLSRLTDQLESEFGLETEGIFRIASSAPATRVLRLGCERGVSPTDAHVDEHAICGLIKSVLRQLNPPLFTFKFYEDFTRIATQTSMGPTQMCERLSLLFGELPLHVIGLCEFLIAFLGRVSGHSMRNKMTPYNLGVVFGPNLLRPRSDNASESLRGSSIPDLVAFIIEHRDRIFPSRSFADFLVHKVNDVVVPVLPPPKAPCDPAPPCRPTPPAQVDDSVPGGASPGALEVPPQAPEERTEDEEQLPPPLPTDDEAESVSDVVPLRRPTICVSDGAETTEFDTDVEETAEEECLDAVETGSVSSLSPSPDMPSPMHNHASEAQPPVDDNELGDMFSMERLCKEMQGISADWDEHLAELAKSVAETMARVQTTGPVDPMVLAHLTRCIEVEREWRAKAEQNGALMLRLLARVEQDENI